MVYPELSLKSKQCMTTPLHLNGVEKLGVKGVNSTTIMERTVQTTPELYYTHGMENTSRTVFTLKGRETNPTVTRHKHNLKTEVSNHSTVESLHQIGIVRHIHPFKTRSLHFA